MKKGGDSFPKCTCSYLHVTKHDYLGGLQGADLPSTRPLILHVDVSSEVRRLVGAGYIRTTVRMRLVTWCVSVWPCLRSGCQPLCEMSPRTRLDSQTSSHSNVFYSIHFLILIEVGWLFEVLLTRNSAHWARWPNR